MYLIPYCILLVLGVLSLTLAYSFFQKKETHISRRALMSDEQFLSITRPTLEKVRQVREKQINTLLDATIKEQDDV